MPHSVTANDYRGNAINLGTSNYRFKDLHLSGYAYVGALKTSASIESLSNLSFWVPNVGEAVRIEANTGNLLVGTTDSALYNNTSGSGTMVNSFGRLDITRNDVMAIFNRNTSDGEMINFRKDGSTVGSIGTVYGRFFIGNDDTFITFKGSTDTIYPATSSGGGRDNAINLGDSGTRFKDIYATNGTIQTSDRNEKQDIAELSEAEQRVAVAAKGLLRKFRWKSAVEEKGDEARTHFGIIAQDLQDAFTAEGLDAGDYAMFINTTWTDEETGEEKSRMGVRYSELLAFIISAI